MSAILSSLRRWWDNAQHVFYVGWNIFLRDIRSRYRQTYFGIFWFFTGSMTTAIPLIILGRHFNFSSDKSGNPYEVFAIIGVVLWQVFWGAIQMPQMIIRRFRLLLRGVALPAESMVIVCGLYILFNSMVQIVFILVVAIFMIKVPSSFFLGVISVPALMLCGFTAGIFLAPINLIYRDIRYALPYLSSVIMVSSPVFYATPDRGVLRYVHLFNPVTYLIGIPRQWFIEGFAGNQIIFPFLFGICMILLVMSLRFYQRSVAIAMAAQ